MDTSKKILPAAVDHHIGAHFHCLFQFFVNHIAGNDLGGTVYLAGTDDHQADGTTATDQYSLSLNLSALHTVNAGTHGLHHSALLVC